MKTAITLHPIAKLEILGYEVQIVCELLKSHYEKTTFRIFSNFATEGPLDFETLEEARLKFAAVCAEILA